MTLLDVKYFHQGLDWQCIPACFKMCIDYFHDKNLIIKKLTFDEIIELLRAKPNSGSLWSPDRTRENFKERIPNLEVVQHPKDYSDTFIPNMRIIENEVITKRMPVIIHYDFMKFEYDIDDMIGKGHGAVVVGKTAENLVVHDPLKRANYKLFLSDFMGAWSKELNRLTTFNILKIEKQLLLSQVFGGDNLERTE